MVYIILSVLLVAIAAYYPIKLIKFYCMESKEQSVKNQIISDLRAGRISRQLVGLILGDGGYRLMRRELDHIFEWMVMNTDEWRVTETSDNRRLVVVFRTSPFHPENWDDIDTYKNVMRQMFGEYGTKDFRVCRASMNEADRIWQNLKDLRETKEAVAKQHEEFRNRYGNIVRGSYLKSGVSLYIVESVDTVEEKATAIRLLYTFIKQPAGEKCILPLEKGFKLITAEEAAEILLKEYSHE